MHRELRREIHMRLHLFTSSNLLLSIVLSVFLMDGFPVPAQSKDSPKQAAPAETAKPPASDWKKIAIPQLNPFTPQKPRRVVLANGLVLLLQEDRELPLISGSALVRGGSLTEPAQKIGLISIFGQAWRTGGSAKRTGDELDDFLEVRAAKVETGGGGDHVSMNFSCLKEDFGETFDVFLELLQKPEFRQDKIDLAKQQLKTMISRRNDDVSEIAGREGEKLAFGPDHPAARQMEYWTVDAVTREDLLAWHREHVHPNRMILGIVGDFDPTAMEARIRTALGDWAKGPDYQKPSIEYPATQPGIYLISKEDVNQSSIRMVQLGTRKKNPDYYALQVMNEILGGGFSSRLVSNVRSKKGFAYDVGGGVGTDWDAPGVYELYLSTQSGKTVDAIEALREEIDLMIKNPGTAEEIKRAKDSILNSFIFRYQTKGRILSDQLNLEFYGYPSDFNEQFRAGIEKVAAADVARVVNKYLKKEGFALLVVGKEKDFGRPLSLLGEVKKLDIAIPSEPSSHKDTSVKAKDESPQDKEEGKKLAVKVAEAMGGPARLREVKSIRIKGIQNLKTPQGDLQLEAETIFQFPNRKYIKAKTPMGELTTVITEEVAFMSMAGKTQDFPASRKEEMAKDNRRDSLLILQDLEDPKVVFTVTGKEKIGDAETVIVQVDANGTRTRWYIDPLTGRILRSGYQGIGMSGPTDRVVDYSDWKNFQGIILPTRHAAFDNGKETGWMEILEVEFNPPIEAKIFQKP